LEPLHRIERVPWGARMEGAKEQKRRADRVKPSEQDLADELLRAVHATSPDPRKTGCYRAGLFSLMKPARKLLRLSRVTGSTWIGASAAMATSASSINPVARFTRGRVTP